MAADPFNMAIYAPLRLNNQFTLAPEPGSGTGIAVLQPDDALFIPLKIRPAAYGTEDPPLRDFNLVLSDPTDAGGTRKNRVITFGYNNNGDGFPESPDAYTLCDRWETNWVINGHNHFERHIQYVSINPGPNYMKMFRPLSIFIDKDIDSIQTDLSADSISINSADGSVQYFKFLGLSLQCLNGSRIVSPNTGSKTLISALGLEGFFGDVIGMDASDRIILGSPNIAGGTLVTGGDLTVDQGSLNIGAGGATVKTGVTVTDGDVTIQGSGHGLRMTESGSDARIGVVTLVNGVATVSTTGVTTNSRIFLTSQQDGNGQAGAMRVSSRIPGVSFTISSSRTNDTATVAWMIIEPN